MPLPASAVTVGICVGTRRRVGTVNRHASQCRREAISVKCVIHALTKFTCCNCRDNACSICRVTKVFRLAQGKEVRDLMIPHRHMCLAMTHATHECKGLARLALCWAGLVEMLAPRGPQQALPGKHPHATNYGHFFHRATSKAYQDLSHTCREQSAHDRWQESRFNSEPGDGLEPSSLIHGRQSRFMCQSLPNTL